jgi:hypothetical protein
MEQTVLPVIPFKIKGDFLQGGDYKVIQDVRIGHEDAPKTRQIDFRPRLRPRFVVEVDVNVRLDKVFCEL